MSTKCRIAVLVSGGGTNLQALIDARGRGEIPHGEIALVISKRYGFQMRSDNEHNQQIFASPRALAAHIVQHRST